VSSYGERVISESISQSRSGLTKVTIPQNSNALTGFHALADLVLALTNADKDGRVLVVPSVGKGLDLWDGHLKFIMLNATTHFTEVSRVDLYAWPLELPLIVYQYKQVVHNLLLVRSALSCACYNQSCTSTWALILAFWIVFEAVSSQFFSADIMIRSFHLYNNVV